MLLLVKKKKIGQIQDIIKEEDINNSKDLIIGNKLNTCSNNKTIWHILDYSYGLGDYLRGSIFLCQYAKKHNINIKLYLKKHNISKYLDNQNDILLNQNLNITKINELKNNNLLDTFIKSKATDLYINSNLFYDKKLVTNDIKNYINSFFKFKQIYYDKAKELIKFDKYNVLHIRCLDKYFNTEFNSNNLLVTIIKLQLPDNTIVISNNLLIKKKINKLFGFYYIDNIPYHSANKDIQDIESTIIDYIILSKSSHTYCISYYDHGSGFSEQCSVLNNIPYKLILLNDTFSLNNNDIKLLFGHYDDLLDKKITNKL